jgi:hypothetical protein
MEARPRVELGWADLQSPGACGACEQFPGRHSARQARDARETRQDGQEVPGHGWRKMAAYKREGGRPPMIELPPLPSPSVWNLSDGDLFKAAALRSYGAACARAAVEAAARECDRLWTRAGNADECADAIRALKPAPPRAA